MWQTNTLGTAACIVRRWRDRLAFSVNSARHWLHLKRPLRTFRAREALRSAGRVAMSGTERRAARSLVLHWPTCQFWPDWYWPITALNVTGKIMGTKEDRKKRIQNLVLVLVCSSPMSTVCLLVLNITMLCTQLCKGFRWNAASPPSTQPQHTELAAYMLFWPLCPSNAVATLKGEKKESPRKCVLQWGKWKHKAILTIFAKCKFKALTRTTYKQTTYLKCTSEFNWTSTIYTACSINKAV